MDIVKFKAQLQPEEDKRSKPYYDSRGYLTIGIGRNLTTKGLRDDEIDLMFKNDAEDTIKDLDAHCPWWSDHDDVRQRVLADMCFNMGISTFLTFTTFLALFKLKRYQEAADDGRGTLWYKQVKGRGERLMQMLEKGYDIPPLT